MVSNYWTLLFYELRINLLKIKTNTAMIKIEGLSKFFRTEEVETIALNKVSLNILKRMNISHLI